MKFLHSEHAYAYLILKHIMSNSYSILAPLFDYYNGEKYMNTSKRKILRENMKDRQQINLISCNRIMGINFQLKSVHHNFKRIRLLYAGQRKRLDVGGCLQLPIVTTRNSIMYCNAHQVVVSPEISYFCIHFNLNVLLEATQFTLNWKSADNTYTLS